MEDKPTKPTKPTTLRQRAFRERKAAAELAEVRGIFAPMPMHPKIKAAVAKLLKTTKDKHPPGGTHEKDPL